MPKVSIIVPVYNSEPYLKRCVDSILEQTFKDYELILVDDGSPDRCGEICDEYAAADRRVMAIHKDNDGVSSARNAGLDAAEGEYVLFCDSDDYLNPGILEYAAGICESGADICMFGFARVNEEGVLYKSSISENFLCCADEIEENAYVELVEKNYITGVWAKLISRSLINGKRFNTSLCFGEDMVFCLSLLKENCMIFASKDIGYNYWQNSGSLTANVSLAKCRSAVAAYRYLFEFARNRSRDGKMADFVRVRWLEDFKGLLYQICRSKESTFVRSKMIRSLLSERELRNAAELLLSSQEKHEFFAMMLKSLFPKLTAVLGMILKKPKSV